MADGEDLAYIDAVDVYDLGLQLTAMPGVWAQPASSYNMVDVPFQPGVTLTTDVAQVGARQLFLRALGKYADAATAETTLATLRDAVIDRLVKISFAHATGRGYYGVLNSFPVDHRAPLALPGWVDIELGFLCPDPYAVDDALTTVSGIAAERVSVTVGTAPTYPIATVTGAATAPVLTLRTHDGEVVGTMTAANIAAGDCWRVDTLHGLSEKCVSGTWSSNIADLTDGFKFPVILPRYAGRSLSSWPTLEVSSGTLAVAYARRWT